MGLLLVRGTVKKIFVLHPFNLPPPVLLELIPDFFFHDLGLGDSTDESVVLDPGTCRQCSRER